MAPGTKNKVLTAVTAERPMEAVPFTVARVHRELHDTFSLDLKLPSTGHTFEYRPGQFNMLYMYGVGEVPISISGDPLVRGRLVHTIRAVGAVTDAMSKLKAGDTVGVRGPYGVGWPVDEAVGHDVVLVAGGIGLAPIRPVIYHLLAHRDKYGKIILLFGARSPEDILYRKLLEKWRGRLDLETYITVDRASRGWHGNVGVVTTLIQRAPFDPYHCLAMVCGPEIMMRFTVLELQKRGVFEDKIYVSMERNMKCGIGLCGHCQMGPYFVCKDGPVFNYDRIKELFNRREL